MSNDEEWKMNVSTTIWIVSFILLVAMGSAAYTGSRGWRSGRCTEMCRPAQFDSAQEVNGGCLCIGSDKVLRFKPIP